MGGTRIPFLCAIAVVCGTSFGQNTPEPVPTFGTTVVDTAGFRGTIYYLNPNTGILPDSFKRLKPKGTIYTRSLNVPPRHFTEGFPGVTKRFEWFAIDYTGAFWINAPACTRSPLPRTTVRCSTSTTGCSSITTGFIRRKRKTRRSNWIGALTPFA